jgi:hypothetical protein
MKKTLIAITAALALGLAGTAAAGEKAAAPAAKKENRQAVGGLKWETPFGPDGPAMAYVSGDPKTGPFQMFLKLKAGGAAGWHTHDADYNAVVVQGQYMHLEQGEATAALLGPGSYWSQPGKANHDDRCDAKGGDCIIFVTSAGAQTFHPKTADGKDAPPPAAPAKDAKAAPPAANK